MPRANDPALQEREGRLDGIGMNIPVNVNLVFVFDGLVLREYSSELHRDALLAHIAEDRKQMGDAEQVADLLVQVDQFEARSRRLG